MAWGTVLGSMNITQVGPDGESLIYGLNTPLVLAGSSDRFERLSWDRPRCRLQVATTKSHG